MTTITGLGLVLLILMVLVGGKQGWTAFLSLLLNFGFLYFAIILVAFHVPPLFVTVTIGITILAITIFMGEDDLRTTVTAFYASFIVVCLILVLIFIIEHWAMVQGFGTEDSDELEGMSTLIGISYFKVSVTTTILSSLGAIAEAAMAISSGLTEILENHPERTNRQLIHSGMAIGQQIIGTYNSYPGVEWAVANGAKVISCSWGSEASAITNEAVMKTCYEKGIIVVAAAGNDNISTPHYPAAYTPYP